MTARIYSYGCLEPLQGGEQAITQLRLASRYRNKLVELERARRDRTAQAASNAFPRIAAIETEIAALNDLIEAHDDEIRRGNASERRKRATPAQQERKRELTRRRADLFAELKEQKKLAYNPDAVAELRAKIKAAVKAKDTALTARIEGELVETVAQWHAAVPQAAELRTALDEIESEHNAACKEARATCGLYWGTYICVEDAAKTFRQGAPPEFVGFRGEGRLGVQVQGGITVAELFGGEDERVKIILDPLPENPSNRQRKKRRGKLWFRIGSTVREVLIGDTWTAIERGTARRRADGTYLDYTLADGETGTAAPGQWRGEAGKPIWLVVQMIYSQPMPENVLIKQVYLHRRREGYRYYWKVSFVLAGQDEDFAKDDRAEHGTVAVNLGWRTLLDGSILAATWVGDDERNGSLRISREEVEKRWQLPRELQSVRTDLLTRYIGVLADWCDENDGILPVEFRQRLCDRNDTRRTLRQWRSSERLVRLMEWWEQHRFPGDEAIFAQMRGEKVASADSRSNEGVKWTGFWRQELHLREWQAAVQARAEQWRRHTYRMVAVQLSRQYRKLLLCDVNWREVKERPEAESNESENQTAKRNAQIVAPGDFEAILKHRFGSDWECLEAENLTQTCAECHRLDPFDAARERTRRCRHCGHLEDQDQRHCRNLLWIASGGVLDETP